MESGFQSAACMLFPALLLCASGQALNNTPTKEKVGNDLWRADSCVRGLQQAELDDGKTTQVLKDALERIRQLEGDFPPTQRTRCSSRPQDGVEAQKRDATEYLRWAGGGLKKYNGGDFEKVSSVRKQLLDLRLASPLNSLAREDNRNNLGKDGGNAQAAQLDSLHQNLSLIEACTSNAAASGGDQSFRDKQVSQIAKTKGHLQSVVKDLGLYHLQEGAVCPGSAAGVAALEQAKSALLVAQKILSDIAPEGGRSVQGSTSTANFAKAKGDLQIVSADLMDVSALPGKEPLVRIAYWTTIVAETAALLMLAWALRSRRKQQKNEQSESGTAVPSAIVAATSAAKDVLEAAKVALQQAEAAQKSIAMLREQQEASLTYRAPLEPEPLHAVPPNTPRSARAEFAHSEEPAPPPPAADPHELTGNAVEDYNRYRRVATRDAEDRFLARYRNSLVQLTCGNLNMYRDEDAELLLTKDSNGNFMAVMEPDGSLSVLPMVGLDASNSRALFAGIFRFPATQSEVRLARAARALPRGGDGNFVVRSTDRGSFESA